MGPEIVSTARPGALRLAGFLALVAGAGLAGFDASMTWATVGFPGDTAHAADVPVRGTDVWEGVAVLSIAAAALVAIVLARVASSARVRRAIAALVLIGGLAIAGLAALDLATATDRFGGGEGLSDVASRLAAATGRPVDEVTAELERNFGSELRVDVRPALPATLAGGVLVAVAGGLTLAWASRRA
jgi:hypothetical protein